MAKVEKTVELSAKDVVFWEEVLEWSDFHPDYDEDTVIDSITVFFGNGFEADIKLCNGDGPFIDPVMFKDGFEVCVLIADGELWDEYVFEHDGVEYVAEIVTK